LVPNEEGPKRSPEGGRLCPELHRRERGAGQSRWPDTAQNCSPDGHLDIAANLPIRGR
jgi:hypothetical protein